MFNARWPTSLSVDSCVATCVIDRCARDIDCPRGKTWSRALGVHFHRNSLANHLNGVFDVHEYGIGSIVTLLNVGCYADAPNRCAFRLVLDQQPSLDTAKRTRQVCRNLLGIILRCGVRQTELFICSVVDEPSHLQRVLNNEVLATLNRVGSRIDGACPHIDGEVWAIDRPRAARRRKSLHTDFEFKLRNDCGNRLASINAWSRIGTRDDDFIANLQTMLLESRNTRWIPWNCGVNETRIVNCPLAKRSYLFE